MPLNTAKIEMLRRVLKGIYLANMELINILSVYIGMHCITDVWLLHSQCNCTATRQTTWLVSTLFISIKSLQIHFNFSDKIKCDCTITKSDKLPVIKIPPNRIGINSMWKLLLGHIHWNNSHNTSHATKIAMLCAT